MAKTRPSPAIRERDDAKSSAPALVLFTDIRGFTRWSETIEVFAHLNRFVSEFLGIIRRRFPHPAFVKGLGDGAMIVRELGQAESDPTEILRGTLRVIDAVQADFDALCREFAEAVGHRTELKLGWGVVRGEVKRLGEDDYVGSNVNKCARLCDIARPFGIVLDSDDFPDPKVTENHRFYRQSRILTGLNEVDVWVTGEIYSQFVAREKLRQKPEVHVAGVCIDTSNRRGLRILIARRAAHRKLFPGLLEGCGGQLAWSESFTEGVERHYRMEMEIEVRALQDFHCFYEIREPNEPVIPGIRFLCERVGEQPPRSLNHSSIDWVTEADFRKLSPELFVGKLKEEALGLIERYRSRKQR